MGAVIGAQSTQLAVSKGLLASQEGRLKKAGRINFCTSSVPPFGWDKLFAPCPEHWPEEAERLAPVLWRHRPSNFEAIKMIADVKLIRLRGDKKGR